MERMVSKIGLVGSRWGFMLFVCLFVVGCELFGMRS